MPIHSAIGSAMLSQILIELWYGRCTRSQSRFGTRESVPDPDRDLGQENAVPDPIGIWDSIAVTIADWDRSASGTRHRHELKLIADWHLKADIPTYV